MATPTFMPLASADKLWGLSAESADELKDNPRRVLPDLVRLFAACRMPVTLWGPVGARKTRTLEALAREKDENGVPYQVITVQPSTVDPTVIHGLMYTSLDSETGETVMRQSIPDIAQQIIKYHEETGGLTILFLDEMTTCMPAQQHALLGILTHGKYGDKDIQNLTTIVMAANPEGTVNSVYDLDVQFLNRGGHIPWYGDPELFLEEWSSGFGRDDLKPDPDTEWFVSTLLHQDMESAFRNKRWDVDNLVPWDLIEHTERTTTELGKVYSLVNTVFRDSPTSVRPYYVIEATKALQGKEWAKKAAIVCSMEHEKIDGRKAIKVVREHEVSSEWDTETLQQTVGNDMYQLDVKGEIKRLGQDQINEIAQDLIKKVEKRGYAKAKEHALSLWAFAMTAPDDGTLASLHQYLVQLLVMGLEALNNDEIEKHEARPEFVTEQVRENLKASFHQ